MLVCLPSLLIQLEVCNSLTLELNKIFSPVLVAVELSCVHVADFFEMTGIQDV